VTRHWPAAVRPERIDLYRVVLPLARPLASARGVEAERRSILVRVADSAGLAGWGECPALTRPTYTGEWHRGAWQVLTEELAPDALADRPSPVRGHPMATGALATARLDLDLRGAGRSLAAAIDARRTTVDTTAVLGLASSIDQVVDRVAALVGAGQRSVKLKIERGWDLEPLRAVRSTWPDLGLAADANGSYTLDDLNRLRALADVGLLYLEQPLPPDDLLGHARLAGRIAVPVALDESATSPGAVAAALALGPIGAVNIKPARLGGVDPSVEVHDLVVAAGVAAFVGGMLELGIGRAAALAVAALPGCTLPTDLGPSDRYVADDVTAPFVLGPGAVLSVPDGPGIGVDPRPDRLAEITVDHVVLTRS